MKKIKKYLVKLFFIFIIILMVIFFLYFMINKNGNISIEQEKNSRILTHMNQEKLKDDMELINQYIEEVTKEPQIIISEVSGSCEIGHSKVNNDSWFDFLVHSDVILYAKYTTYYQIKSENISFSEKTDGVINVNINKKDINISVSLYDLSSHHNRALLGSSYKPNEVTSLINLGRQELEQKASNHEDIEEAVYILKEYLYRIANKCEIKIQVNII